jgi:hypothetical protein
VVSPARGAAREKQFRRVVERVSARHARALKRLAE